jgi:hypothetical protein
MNLAFKIATILGPQSGVSYSAGLGGTAFGFTDCGLMQRVEALPG